MSTQMLDSGNHNQHVHARCCQTGFITAKKSTSERQTARCAQMLPKVAKVMHAGNRGKLKLVAMVMSGLKSPYGRPRPSRKQNSLLDNNSLLEHNTVFWKTTQFFGKQQSDGRKKKHSQLETRHHCGHRFDLQFEENLKVFFLENTLYDSDCWMCRAVRRRYKRLM
ncbi:hypothetical protein BsWGS_08666 [Bradybaena similaris]